VWSGPGLNVGSTALTYRRVEGADGAVALDLRAFFDDALERGTATQDWYLLGVEAGFELWRTSSAFMTERYEVRIE